MLGYQDECWFSRVTPPALHAWSEPKRSLRLHDVSAAVAAGEPKALSCYGLLRQDTGGMLLRFVDGRPVSELTEAFLHWVCEGLAAEGKRALLLVWDNAAWHTSRRVRVWIRAHNRRVKREGGVRIVACFLPKRSPWLNAIEPQWVHGKRAVVEPDRLLTPAELMARLYAYYGCSPTEHLSKTAA